MRHLATVREIAEIMPHPNADRLELATLDGWQCVVVKGKYTAGMKVVYCEIDSFLPVRPEYEFLRPISGVTRVGDKEGFRIRTVKLRGQISQGLILDLPSEKDFDVGTDLTESLGITLYERPEPGSQEGQEKASRFPEFIPKTEEPRVQNQVGQIKRMCESLSQDESPRWLATEKLDGSSITVYLHHDHFGVCSRNLEVEETPGNMYWETVRALKLEEKLRELGRPLALQGELIGEKIQGNRYKIKGRTIYFFHAIDLDISPSHGKYLDWDETQSLLNSLSLQTVPLLYENFNVGRDVKEMLADADGPSALNPKTKREGLVVRTPDRLASFKIISNAFLLAT